MGAVTRPLLWWLSASQAGLVSRDVAVEPFGFHFGDTVLGASAGHCLVRVLPLAVLGPIVVMGYTMLFCSCWVGGDGGF